MNKIAYCEWVFSVNGPLGMKIASELGFSGVQLADLGGATTGFPFLNPRVQEGYLEASAEYHVELQHMHLYTLVRQGLMNQPIRSEKGEHALQSICNGIQACAQMKIPGIMMSAFFDTTINSRYELDNFGDMLNFACDYGADFGVQPTLECVAPIDRILYLIERTGGRLKICYDTQNPVRSGSGDPSEEIRKLGADRIDHVHVKDAVYSFTCNALLGTGCVGFDKTMQTLQEVGYTGWYVTENRYEMIALQKQCDPFALAKTDADRLKQMLRL